MSSSEERPAVAGSRKKCPRLTDPRQEIRQAVTHERRQKNSPDKICRSEDLTKVHAVDYAPIRGSQSPKLAQEPPTIDEHVVEEGLSCGADAHRRFDVSSDGDLLQ